MIRWLILLLLIVGCYKNIVKPACVELCDVCYNTEETTELDLCTSTLSGEISPEIGNLTNLTYLGLGWNQLTGLIPEEICNIEYNSPAVYNNQLCPPYPDCLLDECRLCVEPQDTSDCP